MNAVLKRLLAFSSAAALTVSSATVSAGAAEKNTAEPSDIAVESVSQGLESKFYANDLVHEVVEMPDEDVIRELENRQGGKKRAFRALRAAPGGRSFSSDYYRDQLSDNEKSYYDKLKEECEKVYKSDEDLESNIIAYVDISNYNITADQAMYVMSLFELSEPKYFFLCGKGANNSGSVFGIIPDMQSGAVRKEYREKIEKLADEWLADIDSAATPLEKEQLIVRKLADHTTYHYDENNVPVSRYNNQTIAGSLVDGTCVCAGYASAVQFFCNAAGLNCITVESDNHAWNIIELYNNWYEVDATWADQDEEYDSFHLDYSYLNKSRSAMTEYNNAHDFTAFFRNCDFIPAANYDTVQNYSCTITFDTGTSDTIDAITGLEWGESLENKKPDDPTRSDKKFVGWYYEDKYIKPFDFAADPAQDIELKALWCDKEEENVINDDGVMTRFVGGYYDKSIFIPKEVKGITADAVRSMSTYQVGKAFARRTIDSITVEEGNTAFKTIDGVLYTADGEKLVYCPTALEGDIVVPSITTEIGPCAFFGRNLPSTSITLSRNTKKIRWRAFNWAKMDTLTLPDTFSASSTALSFIHNVDHINFTGTEERWNTLAGAANFSANTTPEFTFGWEYPPEDTDLHIKDFMKSLTLGDEIGVNYIVEFENEVLEPKMTAYIYENIVSEVKGVHQSDGTYKFTYPVNAKQMSDTIKCSFSAVENNIRKQTGEYTYSVRQYCDTVLTEYDNEYLRNVVVQMLNYGAASQLHFKYRTDDLANSIVENYGYTTDLDPSVMKSGFTSSVKEYQGTKKAVIDTYNLALESKIMLKCYIVLNQGVSADGLYLAYRVADSGSDFAYKPLTDNGENYKVVIDGIVAKRLTDLYECYVCEKNGDEYTQVSDTKYFGPETYANTVYPGNTPTLSNTVNAMMCYCKAAQEYFKNKR